MANKDVAAKYGVTKNTISTWVKNKHKLITSLEKKGMSFSRKSIHYGSYNQIDNPIFHWFVGKRNQKVPIDGIIFKGKALEFAKTLRNWLNKWKKRYKYNNSFLFALFCTTLNIFTKNFHHFSWA